MDRSSTVCEEPSSGTGRPIQESLRALCVDNDHESPQCVFEGNVYSILIEVVDRYI